MDLAMAKAAERYEIRRFGFPIVCPAMDVVCIDEFCFAATRKAAAFVACVHCHAPPDPATR